MALNFSHRPIFPSHLSEDNLVSPIRISNRYFVEGIPELNGDVFVNPYSSREVVECFDYVKDRNDRCGSQESVPNDILDLLPSDPFGMDISSTVTAITGWLDDLEVDYSGSGGNDIGPNAIGYEIFSGLNFILNRAMEFQNFPGNSGFNDNFSFVRGFDVACKEEEMEDIFCHDISESVCNVDDILSFKIENSSSAHQLAGESPVAYFDGDAGAHAALPFALGYLGVRDLLSVERVCKSLCSTVRSDPLLWRSIHIDHPLNEKITNDVLLQLTSRAQGNLQCLSLVECQRITDDGLRHVLVSNPKITKLSVPGCTRLSIDEVVNSVKAIKATGMEGIKHLRIGGLFGVAHSHFEELKFLLGVDSQMQRNVSKLHFYRREQLYISCDDDRAIDIEMCPKCQNLRVVYDCPDEGCQGKGHATTQLCRGCRLCVARCVQCGRCINDGVYEETFCLESLCSCCGKQ